MAIWGLADHFERGQLEPMLSELLAERESRGSRVPVVSLLMRSREDASWIAHAIGWLAVRGRRVVVRTRVVMPKRVVAALTEAQDLGAGVVVELEVAHHKPEVQRALLGEQADPAVALLLQAQHIETLELPIVARIGPVMPGIHDQPNGFMPLVRNVEAADVRNVVVVVGQLHTQQLRNLVSCQRELTIAGLLELGRAYAVDAMILLGSVPVPAEASVYKLRSRRAQVFAHALERIVAELGLELPSCGCRSHCELVVSRPTANGYAAGYESVMGRDLFAGIELR
ncbi:hypothetical protein DB30_06140 [Enhygromyxa salina]|uniref:Uncharacterized protein n=1 Tax=Enhygromyxa salina TaxID=215803 RepID=A0A0C2CUZ8_9BACT|nr:hypothetical protein DB30_06140 [Enhygromyxa salina]